MRNEHDPAVGYVTEVITGRRQQGGLRAFLENNITLILLVLCIIAILISLSSGREVPNSGKQFFGPYQATPGRV